MKGTILFNGNIRFETDFIEQFKNRILSSNHIDSKIVDSKKVLLITAAWQKREFKENHIKQALYDIGIQPSFKNGFDQNIQNLSIYHDFNRFKDHVPSIHSFYHTKQQVIQKVKEFYREKNSGLISILQKQLAILKEAFNNVSLHAVLSYDVQLTSNNLNSINQWELLYHYGCKDIQSTMKKLTENDDEMIKVCHEIDDYFFSNSNIQKNDTYKYMKEELEERILSSNSIFIFGGNVAVLYNRLNFFKLKDTFKQALDNGTNFYTISAGSLSLCDKIIVLDDNSNEWAGKNMYDYELFDVGFGLVKKVQIFPHCRDYIHLEDSDTITYTVERFKDTMCVGLDENSFLLLETYQENGQEFERFSSIGKKDGLYLFNKNGNVKITNYSEELNLPGTKKS